jgi:ABC-2 type transport system permease protein
MKLRTVIRWEFLRTIRSAQFLTMTVLIPAILTIAAFVVSFALHGEPLIKGNTSEPIPLVVALVFAIILFLASFLSGVMTLYSVVREKRSRVVEILLSSISASTLMAGKVVGLGIAGLLQVTVWVAAGYAVASRFVPVSLGLLTPIEWATFPLYFILGFLLTSALYAALGAAMKDVQSGGASGLLGMIPVIPMWLSSAIINFPSSLWVTIAGFFPPFTPAVMMLRIAAVPLMSEGKLAVPLWQIALSLVTLSLGVYLVMRFAARVFEVGMLMYGKSATLREFWRFGLRRGRGTRQRGAGA